MREAGLAAKTKRRFKATTQSKHDLPVAPNLLNQNFSIDRPNAVWVSDITYIATEEGWLYLATTLDLFSRRIVGWAMEPHMKTDLVLASLRMAIGSRAPKPGLVHHSDRGSQYASKRYQEALKSAEMICSMSRKGNCYDNAVQESWYHSLKTELVFHERFKTRAEAISKIFEYIEVFYNRERLHSTLGYKSPAMFESEHLAA
jgi:transposase InsO family protein